MMNSPRRRAREIALKALYQAEMVGCDPEEALKHVLEEVLLYPVLETLARDFIKNSSFQQVLSGEVEEFIPDFSADLCEEINSSDEDRGLRVKQTLEKYFNGLTFDAAAEKPVAKLINKVNDRFKKEAPVLEFARELVKSAAENQKKIDQIIELTAQNWSLERMSSIDRCILRSAACELMFFAEIPVNATINEAIEIAKKYSADRSYEFVNGILDRIRKERKIVKTMAAKKEKNDQQASAT
jgi:N utilization substance protein B